MHLKFYRTVPDSCTRSLCRILILWHLMHLKKERKWWKKIVLEKLLFLNWRKKKNLIVFYKMVICCKHQRGSLRVCDPLINKRLHIWSNEATNAICSSKESLTFIFRGKFSFQIWSSEVNIKKLRLNCAKLWSAKDILILTTWKILAKLSSRPFHWVILSCSLTTLWLQQQLNKHTEPIGR